MDFVKGKSQNRVTAEKMACYKILKVKLTENTTFNSLLHQNWKKKKKPLVEEVKNKAGSAKELLL